MAALIGEPMVIVIKFKDNDEETIRNVRSVTDYSGGIEVRTNDLTVARYDKKEIIDILAIGR